MSQFFTCLREPLDDTMLEAQFKDAMVLLDDEFLQMYRTIRTTMEYGDTAFNRLEDAFQRFTNAEHVLLQFNPNAPLSPLWTEFLDTYLRPTERAVQIWVYAATLIENNGDARLAIDAANRFNIPQPELDRLYLLSVDEMVVEQHTQTTELETIEKTVYAFSFQLARMLGTVSSGKTTHLAEFVFVLRKFLLAASNPNYRLTLVLLDFPTTRIEESTKDGATRNTITYQEVGDSLKRITKQNTTQYECSVLQNYWFLCQSPAFDDMQRAMFAAPLNRRSQGEVREVLRETEAAVTEFLFTLTTWESIRKNFTAKQRIFYEEEEVRFLSTQRDELQKRVMDKTLVDLHNVLVSKLCFGLRGMATTQNESYLYKPEIAGGRIRFVR
jgi:hypothetical protein